LFVVLVVGCNGSLFGCNGLNKTDNVTFRSVYLANDYLTLYVTADGTDFGENEIGSLHYFTNLKYEEVIKEIENNKATIYYISDYMLFSVEDKPGVYFLDIKDSTRKGFNLCVTVSDMRCDINDAQESDLIFPFPYFTFSNERIINIGQEYPISEPELFAVLNLMNIYDIKNQDGLYVLSYRDECLKFTIFSNKIVFIA